MFNLDTLKKEVARAGFNLLEHRELEKGIHAVIAKRESDQELAVWTYNVSRDSLGSGNYYMLGSYQGDKQKQEAAAKERYLSKK